MLNYSLMTDYYEYTMGQGYFDAGRKDEIAVFDIFFRKNPFNKGYGIMGGLSKVVEFVKNFHYTEEDIAYLKETGKFTNEFLEYLRNIKFSGNIYAVPDGTVVFANEPIITVKAPIIEAQLLETALLSYVNAGIMYTTASKRVSEAAGNIPIMEFGARRALGTDAAIEASMNAYIGGCVATSNTLAGKIYGIPVSGTMAHSYITSFDSEYDAFLNYAKTYPNDCVLLVDTYNVLQSGVVNAIRVAKEYLIPNGYRLKGIRIDSGDLAYLSKEAKKMLVEAGLEDTKICLSNGLNETTIKSLLDQGAVIDSIGLGDNIVLPDYARVGCVYKNVAVEKKGKMISKIKVSDEMAKAITPGYKKVIRFYDKETGYALGDVVALNEEVIPTEKYVLIDPKNEENTKEIINYQIRELQVPIFLNGLYVYQDLNIKEKQIYCKKEMDTLYPEIKRSENPHAYYVDLTKKLLTLKKELIREAKEMKANDLKLERK